MLIPDVFDEVNPDSNFFGHFMSSGATPPMTLQDFKAEIDSIDSRNSFRLCAFNIRSYFKNIEQFLATIVSVNFLPEILLLCETWLKDSNVELAVLQGYRQAHTLRVGAASGGVSIFYK